MYSFVRDSQLAGTHANSIVLVVVDRPSNRRNRCMHSVDHLSPFRPRRYRRRPGRRRHRRRRPNSVSATQLLDTAHRSSRLAGCADGYSAGRVVVDMLFSY